MKRPFSLSIIFVVWLKAAVAVLRAAPSKLSADFSSDLWAREELNPKVGSSSSGTQGKVNVCINGRLAPELLVIGAAMGGTSSFCAALDMSSSILYPRSLRNVNRDRFPQTWKEGHFFDKQGHDTPLEAMLEEYGACDTSGRSVGVDCSANYGAGDSVADNVALKMGLASRHMSFVYLVREPSQRLLTHYWHMREASPTPKTCLRVKQLSFRGVVNEVLSGVNWDWLKPCQQWIDSSLYPLQVERWFKFFEPEQFTFIPHRLHVDAWRWPQGVHPVEHVWKSLGVGGAAPRKPLFMNHQEHPPLELELHADMRHDLEAWLEVKGGALGLARLLAPTGADLYGHPASGLPRDVPGVARWLRESW